MKSHYDAIRERDELNRHLPSGHIAILAYDAPEDWPIEGLDSNEVIVISTADLGKRTYLEACKTTAFNRDGRQVTVTIPTE